MADIVFVASGACAECGHGQESHEDNHGCVAPSADDPSKPRMCSNIGNY